MRKHGWQLPYHPLQVVAVAVFLALGFAFYVFFAPFVGKKMFQCIAIGIYTPLIACVFGLYIWCAASDPADTGVFRSKKYINNSVKGKDIQSKDSKLVGDLTSSLHASDAPPIAKKHADSDVMMTDITPDDPNTDIQKQKASSDKPCCFLSVFSPCAFICNCSNPNQESSEQQLSEDGMFFCSLCEVEVFKNSKHCRVCDKCVDCFDHHCRWLNNCIGKRNYRQFFILMVFALLLLIIQWSTGILVLVCCFLERKRYSVDVSSKLGSSFSLVPFVIVVSLCSILAMIATLPLAQLFFFHILLIKKGISTYDYIVALREQEQEQQGTGGQQSPQMSIVSSLTGLSSASSFNTFHRATWCTPPRLFLEDQFDVVPPETGSVSSLGKKIVGEEPVKKRNPAVKISPWTLARLNADEVSKAAAEAKKRSKILQPVTRQEASFRLEADSSFGSSGRRVVAKPDNNRRRASKRVRLPADLPVEPITKVSAAISAEKVFSETSTSLAPLQLEARSAFQTSRAMSTSAGVVASSPESSLDSPDIHPFRISSSGAEDSRQLTVLSGRDAVPQRGIPFSRSTSDGYEASGGEDSDQVPSRIVQRSGNWSNILFRADHDERGGRLKMSSSSSHVNDRMI